MTARILLVEDDPVSRELIAALLASRGHAVDTVDDGFGALRMAQATPYDLVFVDYHLPEMDGYALARLMRSLAETTKTDLKMVAITADRFGLAARRGVDTIFDSVLPKPIDPDDLFAFVDEFLCPASASEDIAAFLDVPAPSADAHSAGQMLWRARGLDMLPAAAVFPTPSPDEREKLEHCFRLVTADEADCVILLRQTGLGAVEALRAMGKVYLQPLVVIDPKLEQIADVRFDVGDGDSWSATAAAIRDFAARRRDLKPGIAGSDDFDTRVAAYLFVADQALDLRRDATGRTMVPYTAGFSSTSLIEAIKGLAARGLVAAKLDPSADEERRLVVTLTPKGSAFVMDSGRDRTKTAS